MDAALLRDAAALPRPRRKIIESCLRAPRAGRGPWAAVDIRREPDSLVQWGAISERGEGRSARLGRAARRCAARPFRGDRRCRGASRPDPEGLHRRRRRRGGMRGDGPGPQRRRRRRGEPRRRERLGRLRHRRRDRALRARGASGLPRRSEHRRAGRDADAGPRLLGDPNGDPLTIEVVKGPANGTLGAINQGAKTVSYTPNGGFSGVDLFEIRATSDGKQSDVATVVVGVQSATGSEGPQGPPGAPALELLIAIAADQGQKFISGKPVSLTYLSTVAGQAT